MANNFNRRDFIKTSVVSGLGIGLSGGFTDLFGKDRLAGKRVGIIGLDTSHSIAFAKTLNSIDSSPEYKGYKVTVAYPQGSKDIESSTSRVPRYIEEIQKLGVEIVDTIEELIKRVDVVMLESNDGRVHLEQALPVLKAGKRIFIDKPIAGSLSDTIAIFNAARKYNVPIFSSSSLRYMESVEAVRNGNVGKVLGADTFSPAALEHTHPDLLWYGIHGIETLFSVMGTGCKSITRTQSKDADVVVGIWNDGRIGTFRGMRNEKAGYGGTVYGEKGISVLGPYGGYNPLLVKIIDFFDTGISPVDPQETIEIVAFAVAADESKRKGGSSVEIEELIQNEIKSNS
jgi:predicted dehydrogenase